MPESKVVPSSLVTVWGALVVLVQVMVVPTLMVMVAGLNAKVPLLVIETAIAGPDDVAVAVGAEVGVLPAGAVVGVGVEPPPVDPPQAASTIMAANASRTNHAPALSRLVRVTGCVFTCIAFLLCLLCIVKLE